MRYERSNKQMIKQVNRRSILRFLWDQEKASRAEIARKLYLNPATITNLTRELMEEGWLSETEGGDSSGGRPPILLKLNRKKMRLIGVDVGIHSLKFGVVNGEGEMLREWILEDCHIQSGDDLLSYIKEGIQIADQDLTRFLGLGIGMHGFVDRSTGVVQVAPAFGIEDFPLRERLETAFGCTVVVENDVRAMAAGERWFGLAAGVGDFFLINIGDGVGGAICMNGSIQSGGQHMAGEIGHLTLSAHDGVRCSCGKVGCLETEISSKALTRKYQTRTGRSCADGEAVYELAVEGDPDARAVFTEMGEQLGWSLANVIQLLNPERVIVAGGVSHAWDLFAPAMMAVIKEACVARIYQKTKVAPTALRGKAGVLGAATLVIEDWMDVRGGEE